MTSLYLPSLSASKLDLCDSQLNSTTSSSTRVINYSAEEGIIPTRHADMEEDYMARTGRELGPAPPGMDPADDRFTIGQFKPVFPVDDPEEFADQDERDRNRYTFVFHRFISPEMPQHQNEGTGLLAPL